MAGEVPLGAVFDRVGVMDFPVKHTLQLRRGMETINEDGDPAYALGEPEPVAVAAWWLTGGEEPGTDGHIYRVDYDAAAFIPVGANIQPEDEIHLPGVGWFRVDGPVANWDHGPWGSVGLDKVTLSRGSHEDVA